MANNKPPSRSDAKKQKKQRDRAAKRERRSVFWRIAGYSAMSLGALLVIGAGAGVGYVTAMLKDLPPISPDKLTNLSAPSVVYDINRKVIGKFSALGDRQPITSTDQVSKHLVNAFIAAEDKTFYTNIGVNPLAMARAFFQDLFHHQIESGASTITQQTVKLALFPEQQRTLKRKVQEIALAIEANHMLSKNEIMTDYMNWVYMGHMGNQNVYGVKTAAQLLFGKDPKDLNLAESAVLAAIPNNASLFSPYAHPQNTLQRQHYILDQMLANGMITQDEYNQAKGFDVLKEINEQAKKNPQKDITPYPYLMIDNIEPLVTQELVQSGKYDNTDDAAKALDTAGYKIYTSIDLTAQQDVDKVLQNKKLFGNSDLKALDGNSKVITKDGKPVTDMYEAGVTLIDNQTGAIRAIGGGRDFSKDSIDHSDIPRQPGSSIKPLLDYGPAIDMHQLTAASPIFDAPVQYPGESGKVWKPVDDVSFWHGIVTARQALVESLNVPAIKVLDQITPTKAGSYLEKMGITPKSKTIDGQPTLAAEDLQHLSTAIGGMKWGLTVQQMTSAYTVFPNQGIWRKPYLISKITDREGNSMYQFKPETTKVFSQQTAYIMTDILHDVVYKPDGTAYAIGTQLPGLEIAGKTGTTDSHRDGWFVGYTQKYTMGIWMGYNHNMVIPTYPVNYYNLKFDIWSKIMAPLLKSDPPTSPFPEPPNIVHVDVCSKSGQLPTALCKSDNDVYNEMFIQGTEPTTNCQTHVQALYTVVNGKRYLATTNTPPNEVRNGIFLIPPGKLDPGVTTLDSKEYIPTEPDPRGGTVLANPSAGQLQTLAAPTGVQAAASNGTVQVSWTPVDGATGYYVYRGTTPNGPFASVGGPVTTTTFTDSALPASGGTLYYQVYAISGSGISPPSAPVSVTVPASGGTDKHGGGNRTGNKTP